MSMEMPEFDRAEYSAPVVMEGYGGRRASGAAFPKAVVCGVVAAVVGCVAYAVIGFSGFMVSIVAIGVGWAVAKAMMTGSDGVGGRAYQVAAVVLTYVAVTTGNLLDVLHYSGIPLRAITRIPAAFLMREIVAGPFLALSRPINGALGLVILFVGLRAAWQIAAGSPGFGGGSGGRRMTLFGLR